MKDYYQILGVEPDASSKAIKSAFRARAKSLHPDLAGPAESNVSGDGMRLLLEAYRVLSDPTKRHEYDFERKKRARRETERSSFDYRVWLKERQEEPEYQAKLVFYDLLHDLDDEALSTYETMRLREEGRLERFFERAEAMDAELCIAELYEKRERLSEAYAVYVRLIRMELEKPTFGYFFEVVIADYKRLVLEKLGRSLSWEDYLGILDEAVGVDPIDADKAAYLKRKAEILIREGRRESAVEAFMEARTKAPRLAGLAPLAVRLGLR